MNNNIDFLEILDEFPSGIIIIKKPSENILINNNKNKTINSTVNTNYSIYYSNMYISKIFPKTFLIDNNNASLYRLDIEENYKLLENFFIECSHFKLFNINKNNLSEKTLRDDILKNKENIITETYINEYYMILVKIKKINEFILININDYIEQKEMLNKKLIKSIEFDYFNTVNHEIKNPINFLYNFDLENNNYRTAIFLLKNCLKRFILISKIMFDKNLNNFMFSVLNLNYLFFKVYKKYKLLFDYKKIQFKNNNNNIDNSNNDSYNNNTNNNNSNILENNNNENMFDFLNDFFFKCDEFYFKNLIKNLFYYFYLLLPEKSNIYLEYKYNLDDTSINEYNKKLILIFYYENLGNQYNSLKSLNNININNNFLKIELNDTVKSLDFSKNIINDICEILNINIIFNNINNNSDINNDKNLYSKSSFDDNKKEILVMEINNVIYNKNNILFDKKKYDFVKNEIDCSGINGKIIKKLNNNIEFKFSNYIENLPSSSIMNTINDINYNTNEKKVYNKSKFCDNNKEIKNNNNINFLSTNDNNINNSNNNLFNNNNYKDNNVIIVNYFTENSKKDDNNNFTDNIDDDNNQQNKIFKIFNNNSHNSNNSVSSFNNSINSYNNNNSFFNQNIESRNHNSIINNNNNNINNNNNNNNNNNFNYKKINTINTFKNFGKLVNNLKEPILNNIKTQKKFDEKKILNNFKRFNTVILKKKKLTKTRSLELNYFSNKSKLQYYNKKNINKNAYNNNNFINSNIINNKKNSYYPNLKVSNKISSNFFSNYYNIKKKNKEINASSTIGDLKKKTIKNILVVDDEEYNQKTLKNLLKKSFKLNCEIDIAINGEDCLQKLKEKNYYMIFMDLYMPVMNGVEAMKNIQNNLNGKDHYKVIVVSAHSYESVKNELKEINIINKFVQKPLNKKKLEEILNEFYY